MYQFFAKQLIEQGCSLRIINGMPDHVPCLFLLNPLKSIDDIIKPLKGGRAHFVNQNDLIIARFAWQMGYAAYTVSESAVERVDSYIKNR